MIVNATNKDMLHDEYIERNGGPEIQEESNEWMRYHGRPSFGCAVETTAGKLNCKHLIHTVGPMYMRHDPDKSRDHYIDVCSEYL